MTVVDCLDLLPLLKDQLKVQVDVEKIWSWSGRNNFHRVKVTLLWGDAEIASDFDDIPIPNEHADEV